jgi:dolichol-phosphate mannosyltransferase
MRDMAGLELSLVVPTFNERENIVPLLAELRSALRGLTWELLFVDDSTDGTDQAVADLANSEPRVRLLHRDENRGGLAGAVVEGLNRASGSYVCVLDADLQHPPQHVPLMLAEAKRSGADLVIASRYMAGGSPGGLGGPLRHTYSRGLRRLTLCMFPRRLAQISDPLGGYFLLSRGVLGGVELRPVGYKILLEVLIRCRWTHASEIPYVFRPRQFGESKADIRQGVLFLRHLLTLVWDCSPLLTIPRLVHKMLPNRHTAPVASSM